MDGLLALLTASLIFAATILIVSRTAKRFMLIGAMLAVITVLLVFGVFG